MHTEPLAHLPALVALALAAFSLPAHANTRLMVLCSGTPAPATPDDRRSRDCDSACHVGCQRQKKSGRLC